MFKRNMSISNEDRLAVYDLLFMEGVIVFQKSMKSNHDKLTHMHISDVLEVLKELQDCNFVKEQSSKKNYYWCPTKEGINFVRDELHMAGKIIMARGSYGVGFQRTRAQGVDDAAALKHPDGTTTRNLKVHLKLPEVATAQTVAEAKLVPDYKESLEYEETRIASATIEALCRGCATTEANAVNQKARYEDMWLTEAANAVECNLAELDELSIFEDVSTLDIDDSLFEDDAIAAVEFNAGDDTQDFYNVLVMRLPDCDCKRLCGNHENEN